MNKSLALILEWADMLRLTPYRETYNALLAKGAIFPERTPEQMAPIHTHQSAVHHHDLDPADAAAIAAAIEQAENELARERELQVEEGTRRRVAEHMESGVDFMNARKAEKRRLPTTPQQYMAVPDDGEYVAPAQIYNRVSENEKDLSYTTPLGSPSLRFAGCPKGAARAAR